MATLGTFTTSTSVKTAPAPAPTVQEPVKVYSAPAPTVQEPVKVYSAPAPTVQESVKTEPVYTAPAPTVQEPISKSGLFVSQKETEAPVFNEAPAININPAFSDSGTIEQKPLSDCEKKINAWVREATSPTIPRSVRNENFKIGIKLMADFSRTGICPVLPSINYGTNTQTQNPDMAASNTNKPVKDQTPVQTQPGSSSGNKPISSQKPAVEEKPAPAITHQTNTDKMTNLSKKYWWVAAIAVAIWYFNKK
jgi:hypothetical protein